MSKQIIVIPGGGADFYGRPFPDFVIRDRLTVYDLCMVCTNENPAATSLIRDLYERTFEGWEMRLVNLGAVDCWQGVRYGALQGTTHNPADDDPGPENCREHYTDDPAWTRNDFYRALVDAIKAGKLNAKNTHLRDQPDLLDYTISEVPVRPAVELLLSKGYSGPMLETLREASGNKDPADSTQTRNTQDDGPVRTGSTAGIRTNRAANAETACREYLSGLEQNQRPENKDAAFVTAKEAAANIGPLSRKAFERAWQASVPPGWHTAGRRRNR
jgi:hypothetical protein